MNNPSSLTGKTFFITGTSRGIGLGLTRQLLDEGCRVIATARDPASASDLQRLVADYSDHCTLFAMDVSSDESVKASERHLPDEPIDVLINNAGIFESSKEPLETSPVEGMMRMYNTNTLGCVRVVKLLLPFLQRSSQPAIVNVSSAAGSIGKLQEREMLGDGYRMSKTAVNMFTKCLSISYPDIISITLSPGWVRTDMGGPNAPISVEESVNGIRAILERLSPEDSGTFFQYTGGVIPW